MFAPRTLVCDFPLGRPLGRPSDAIFQTNVLKAGLALLKHESGPVFVDYPEVLTDEASEQISCALPPRFDPAELSRDLKVAGLRAGLVASGSLMAGLKILAAQAQGELPSFLADPVAQGLITFALGEDHAVVAR